MSVQKLLSVLLLGCLSTTPIFAQVPYGPIKPVPAGEILSNLKKLNVLGSVLYVAAHPDDENTLLLAYLAKERLVRTGYLSLTRGDGGQNLIGAEQGENIGVIRTQELLAARRIDGPDQFFSRAYDFGFSKSTDEAVRIWGQDKVLADVVWTIRKYQPDVIITRFPPDARAGHGHHSASGFLAEEAFKISNDPTKFPEQLTYVKPWQARRILWNVFIPGAFMSNRKPEEAGNLVGIETGLYNPLLGKSYGEIAAESRSQHKSQGFGVSANRGARIDYLLLKGGEPVQKDPLDAIDLSWKRVADGPTLRSNAVQSQVSQIISSFRADQPAASVPALVQLYGAISQLDTANIYVKAKRQDVQALIQQCLGLWFETNPANYAATPGETIKLTTNIVSRTDASITLINVRYSTGTDSTLNIPLKPNDVVILPGSVTIPNDQKISQPYWLEKPIVKGLFQVDNQQLIGLPENPPALSATYTFTINQQRFTFTRPVVYKSTDPVEGEIYRPFIIQPAITANLTERVYAFRDNAPKTGEVVLKAGRANVSGTLTVDAPKGWKIEPASVAFSIASKGDEQRATFTITPTPQAQDGKLQAVMTIRTPDRDGITFTTGLRQIAYKHIPTQTLFPPAEAKVEKIDVNVTAKNIGYIVGAGDEVPQALQQMGCHVTLLGAAQLNTDLAVYDAIVMGVRAYNTNDYLAIYQPKLMDYVKNGGTLIVQYVTPGGSGFIQNGLKVSQFGPYPFKVVNERVTDEDAPMTFINPQHRLLNYPNKITEADFSGWIQERGIYFAQDWDKAYEPIFSAHDPNEAPKQGSLIYARYGKGHFMYTGLVFFRELPAGVPGAYRLFANLISVGK